MSVRLSYLLVVFEYRLLTLFFNTGSHHQTGMVMLESTLSAPVLGEYQQIRECISFCEYGLNISPSE